MSENHSHADIKKHIRVYLAVFIALLVGTVITVVLNYQHFESSFVTVAVALFVATIKAFLVAAYFMHLMAEKKAIYAMLAVTVFFAVSMMYLMIWSRGQLPLGSEYSPTKQVPHPAANIGAY